jgi:hypothetical protein
MTAAHTAATRSKVLERLALGESLKGICADDDMPDRATVWRWIDSDADFKARYDEARQRGLDALADELILIADSPLMGETTTTKADGGVEVTRKDMLEHRRLQIDARKWTLSKLAPKKYGDKLALGGDAENPLQVVVQRLTDGAKD